MDNYSDRRIRRKIRHLKRLFERCEQERRPGKRRFAHRKYLQSLYEFFAKIGAGVLGTKIARRIAKLYGVPARENAGLIRSIIDVTATNLEPKMASRWARALKFIWCQRQHWTDWQAFVDQHEGIAGCARAMALAKKEMPWPVDDEPDHDDDEQQRVNTTRIERRFSPVRRPPRFFGGSKTWPQAARSAQPMPSSPPQPNVATPSQGAQPQASHPVLGRRLP